MLPLGEAGTHGAPGHLAPVLSGGAVVAALPASMRTGTTPATICGRGRTLPLERRVLLLWAPPVPSGFCSSVIALGDVASDRGAGAGPGGGSSCRGGGEGGI